MSSHAIRVRTLLAHARREVRRATKLYDNANYCDKHADRRLGDGTVNREEARKADARAARLYDAAIDAIQREKRWELD